MIYDVIIIGAGPSGLMCSNFLDKKLKTLILEKNSKPGLKLLITGGGRCNLTNLKDSNSLLEEIDYNKKYLYSTIYNFSAYDIYDYFNKKVKLKEEEDNKIFPVSNKASDILNYLVGNINGVINYNESVLEITKNEINYIVKTNKDSYETKKIVVSTGGASFPDTGSSGDHLKFAKKLGQPVIDLFPAETSIILSDKLDLAGTSFDNVLVSANKISKDGNLMFTHNGLSGTSIMKISEFIYKEKIKNIIIDLLPSKSEEEISNIFLENRDKQPISILNIFFTKRFSNYIIANCKINSELKIKNLTNKELLNIINMIKEYEVSVLRVNDLKRAYVTGGGISLNYLNTKSFESKINNNLYFIGECLDIHGPIGGYNLTLAFSTAVSAARAINEKEV